MASLSKFFRQAQTGFVACKPAGARRREDLDLGRKPDSEASSRLRPPALSQSPLVAGRPRSGVPLLYPLPRRCAEGPGCMACGPFPDPQPASSLGDF